MAKAPFFYMVGMNIPADTNEAYLADFNEFYSNTHVPEVLRNNPGFISGTRYELFAPDGGSPRFVAVYEVESEAAARGHRERTGVTYTKGPSAWEKHDTLWRLTYKLVP